jgi:hypothetical protein
MAELIIALAPLLLLAGIALLATLVPLAWIVSAALALMLLGFLFGVPSGVYYHVLLHRELQRAGPVPKGWYWQPQRYHDSLTPLAVGRLRPWFLLGAAGFGLIVLGFALAVLALALWFRAAGAPAGGAESRGPRTPACQC